MVGLPSCTKPERGEKQKTKREVIPRGRDRMAAAFLLPYRNDIVFPGFGRSSIPDNSETLCHLIFSDCYTERDRADSLFPAMPATGLAVTEALMMLIWKNRRKINGGIL